MTILRTIPLFILTLGLTAGEANTWRGPGGRGVFPAKGIATAGDEAAGKGIVWKQPLPFIGCNSPVYGGGKVFVLCDGGWKSDCPVLLAFEVEDGKEAWRAPVDNLDARPQAEADWARQERAKEYAMARRGRVLQREYNTAKDEAVKAKVIETAEAEGFTPRMDKGRLKISITSCKMVFTKPHAKGQDYKKLKGEGLFEWEGWYYAGIIYQGATFPSAVTDGAHVWVLTNHNAAACFTVDGQRKWIIDLKWKNGEKARYHGNGPINTSSPTLVGDALILSRFDWTVCVDAASGKERWRHPMAEKGAYQAASAAVHVPFEGKDYLYLSSGELVTLADGTVAGRLVHPADVAGKERSHGKYFGGHCQSVAREGMVWVAHSGYGGGSKKALPGVYAFKLKQDGGKVSGEMLWEMPTGEGPAMALDGDRLYVASKGLQVVDALSGKVVKKQDRFGHRHPSFAVTAEHLIGLTSSSQNKWKPDPDYVGSGTLTFYDKNSLKQVGQAKLLMDESTPEVTEKRVARVSKPWWKWGRSSPTAWGNRVFVRSHDALYCLGDKGVPFKE